MVLRNLIQKLLRNVAKVRFRVVLAAAIVHCLLSYGLMSWAGESDLVSNPIAFFYFWVVTSSTVGYGDASPSTNAGMLISALFMIPVSLGLFGVLLTKVSTALITLLRKEMTGMRKFDHLSDHILMMGYHPSRTKEMIELILADRHRSGRMILVVCTDDIEHPFLDVDGVEFCRVDGMTHDDTFERIALGSAAKIVVDCGEDNGSYVLSTLCAARNQNADVITYITDTNISLSLRSQYANIEVIQDNSEEMMIRALQDPGSSQTINQLMRASEGQTIHVTEINLTDDTNVDAIAQRLRDTHGALMLGIAEDRRGDALTLNARGLTLNAGSVWFIHYIHTHRICAKDIAA